MHANLSKSPTFVYHRYRLSESATSSPRKDSAPSRARHRRTFAVRRKQRRQDSDAKAIPNNLRDKPCETKPTDEKARESGQIACNHNRFPAFSLSRSFSLPVYLPWRRCCFCSRWLIASRDVKINGPRCARQTIRVSSFFFIVLLFSSEIVSTAESTTLNRVNSITSCDSRLRVARKACDKTSRHVTFRITNILYPRMMKISRQSDILYSKCNNATVWEIFFVDIFAYLYAHMENCLNIHAFTIKYCYEKNDKSQHCLDLEIIN